MRALDAVLTSLRCPVCSAPLESDGRRVRCGEGHSFDIARQGYVSMLTGRGASTGDTSEMVAARAEVLSFGVLGGVTAAVVEAVPDEGLVLDLAGGTGHYLAAVLDRNPESAGLVVDASAPALRRAARAHPRAAAVAADAWGRLPVASGAVSCALSIFGPRNADELQRVLAPDGRAVVAAPAPDHLVELVDALGLVRVDPRKDERQASTFAAFTAGPVRTVRYRLPLDHRAISALVTMGPSAGHLAPDVVAERVSALPGSVEVTVAVGVSTYLR